MANCPTCHAALTEDFGLIECSSCGAPLIIHVDGTVEAASPRVSSDGDQANELLAPDQNHGIDANANPPEADWSVAPDLSGAQNLSEPSAPGFGASEDPPSENDGDFDFDPQASDGHAGTKAAADPYSADHSADGEANDGPLTDDPIDELFASDSAGEEEKPDIFAEEGDGDGGGGPSADVPEGLNPNAPDRASPNAGSSPDLSDIARFGNSESMGSRDGTLRYNVVIGGIDTSDVREAFREALTDRKFMWDTDEILRSIHDGEVRIENMLASKAQVLVARLRALPVRLHWEQYAVHSN